MNASGLPDEDEVRRAILAAIGAAAPGTGLADAYTRKAKANDYFEAFLLATLLAVAKEDGWTLEIVDGHGTPTTELDLRAAPGSLSANKRFTHARLEHPDIPFRLEAHVGVRVPGYSGVMHEADLVILSEEVADVLRDGLPGGWWPRPVAVVEAKFINIDTVPLGYGRAMVGLAAEMRSAMPCALATTRLSDSVDMLLHAWEVVHLGGILPAPGHVDDHQLRRYFRGVLAWTELSKGEHFRGRWNGPMPWRLY